jgi:lipoate-protein ligase A
MRETWRLLEFHLGSSAWHFCLGDALVRHSSIPSIWWHAADCPTLILGSGQKSSDINLDECARMGIRVIRRHAGGTAVFATPDVLGLDVVLPRGHHLNLPDVTETYRWFGEAWARSLKNLGISTRVVSISEARKCASQHYPWTSVLRQACFGALSPYEVAVGSHKLIGLAQVRRAHATLLQSGLHLHFDASSLCGLLTGGGSPEMGDALRHVAIGLDEVSAIRVARQDVMDAFSREFQDSLDVELVPGEWTAQEIAHAERELGDMHMMGEIAGAER